MGSAGCTSVQIARGEGPENSGRVVGNPEVVERCVIITVVGTLEHA